MRFLITGGAGFIGSNFIGHILRNHPNDTVICLDKLTYAGNFGNLSAYRGDERFLFIQEDICSRNAVFEVLKSNPVDCIVNFAAETHVDRSIENAVPFLETNVLGTGVLLDAVNEFGIQRFHQISTDEVYGDLPADMPELRFQETQPLKPSSPYSASKASADLLALSYYRTFGTPVTISRCSNNYGPCQFPEKLIPLMICNASSDKKLPVYGDGKNVRDWIHVSDHCRAVDRIIRDGRPGEIYNVGANHEVSNLELVKMLLRLLGKEEKLITFVPDRKGHDRRYAVNTAKIEKELNWYPEVEFCRGMEDTVRWYRDNPDWLGNMQSAKYET